ncbi:N-acetyltransferase B complex non catalytic subunit-domain-containing protein [Annulohypoxylon truncatum]|uniref:N-acetyltransferase B complex non catalytic subunit-domain-containing protein n=1 Tax=Annulohypoxylon truncatum TaxID=327061 RepID=UPI0020088765|nr:N-acetyltransferase B complex non catalytic subunit-domain-containing protein [Annulohypoxylon truncatum]KAI1205294.1 N-acetyltransferase B complex non catalytic subunit-domain-containing protein [Annulohypoxylon truncatum]
MIKDNVTVTDIDALDLYEFSCSHVNVKYPETIGVLRVRFVKAAPKDQKACIRCFNACVWNSDWKNAQQIAASLNKNFTDRKFLFQYIMATHLYSLSQDCPEASRKIFASLAKAQADKAFDNRTESNGQLQRTDRTALTESEDWMWLEIRIAHCSPKENLELFKKPGYTALDFLRIGRHEPFWRIIKYFEEQGDSDEIFRIGELTLKDAIRTLQSEADLIEKNEKVINLKKLVHNSNDQDSPEIVSSVKADLRRAMYLARPDRSVQAHCYVLENCEYKVLQVWFNAAKRQADPKKAMKQLGNLIEKLTRALERAGCMQPIYAKSLELMSLSINVSRASLADLGPNPSFTGRVANLLKHVVKNYDNPTSVDEAMVLIRQLSMSEVAAFLATFQAVANQCTHAFTRYTLTSICLKIWYATVIGTGLTCKFCGAELVGDACMHCSKELAENALNIYKAGIKDGNLLQEILSRQRTNPLSDIAVIGSICLLRVARLGNSWTPHGTSSLYRANIQLFMQAVLWLDSCRETSTIVSTDHTLLLIKLYILMGAVPRAKTIWDGLDVKNALLDSLGLLFIDRLSSIAPGLFMGSNRGNPVDPFIIHFTRALKTTVPKRIMDSLDQETYSSIPGIIEYAEKHATSCTVALAVLEERRGARMKTNKAEVPIEDQPLVRDLLIKHELKDVTDYKVFNIPSGQDPKSQSSGETSHQSIVHYGPLPSSDRAHLGLLSERFFDLVSYAQPKEYKPPKAGRVIQLDLEYALATSARLEKDMRTLMPLLDPSLSEKEQAKLNRQQERIRTSLTSPELWYHSIIHRLASLVKEIVESGILKGATNDTRDRIRSAIKETIEELELQTNDFLVMPENIHSKLYGFHGFAALHAMGMLRETVIIFKHTTNYLTTVSEKAKNVDKLRSQAELAWLAPELKKMMTAAASSEKSVKDRIKLLQSYLDNVDGWRDRLCDWVFGEYATVRDEDKEFKNHVCEEMRSIVPKENAEKWADDIGDSWRELIKGWAAVKFD